MSSFNYPPLSIGSSSTTLHQGSLNIDRSQGACSHEHHLPKKKFIFAINKYKKIICINIRDGNRGKVEVFVPAPHGFVLPHPCPAPPRPVPHDGENFLTPSLPLRAPQSPAPPRKTLLFVNFPYN